MPDGSENIGGIDVSVGLDYSDVAADFATIQDQAQGAGEGIAAAFNTAASGTDKLTESAQENVEAFSQLGLSTDDWTSRLDAAIAGSTSLEDSMRADAEAAGSATGPLRDAGNAVEEVGEKSEKAESQSNELISSLMEFAGISVSIEAAREFVGEMLSMAQSSERAAVGIGALRGGVKQATERLEEIHATAEKFGISFESLAGIEQKFAAFGLTVDESTTAMHGAIEASEALGHSVEDTSQAMLRIAMSGQLSERQLLSLGLKLDDIATALHTTSSAAKEAFSSESWEERLITIESAFTKFQGTAEAMSHTTSGSLGQLKEAFKAQMEEIGAWIDPAIQKMAAFAREGLLLGLQKNTLESLEGQIKELGAYGATYQKLHDDLAAGTIGLNEYKMGLIDLIVKVNEDDAAERAAAQAREAGVKSRNEAAKAAAAAAAPTNELAAAHDRLRMAQFADLDAFHAMTLELQKQAIAAQGAGTIQYPVDKAAADNAAELTEKLDALRDKIQELQGLTSGGVPLMGDTLDVQAGQLKESINLVHQLATGYEQYYDIVKTASGGTSADVERIDEAGHRAGEELNQLESSVARAIVSGKSLDQVWHTMWTHFADDILTTVMDALEKLILKIAIVQGLFAALGLSGVGGIGGGGGVTGGTFGFAAHAEGGYMESTHAAVVHAGEYITPAADVARGHYGPRGYAEGGMVDAAGGVVHPGEYVTPAASVSRGEYGPPGTSSSSRGGGIHVGDIHVHGLVMGSMDDLVDAVSDGLIKGARRAGADI